MPTATRQIDTWKIEEVRRYLGREFGGGRIDDYPRGAWTSHLFIVTDSGVGLRQQKRYYLLLTRGFFDRCNDHASLRDALESADVGRALSRAGDRTVELY